MLRPWCGKRPRCTHVPVQPPAELRRGRAGQLCGTDCAGFPCLAPPHRPGELGKVMTADISKVQARGRHFLGRTSRRAGCVRFVAAAAFTWTVSVGGRMLPGQILHWERPPAVSKGRGFCRSARLLLDSGNCCYFEPEEARSERPRFLLTVLPPAQKARIPA